MPEIAALAPGARVASQRSLVMRFSASATTVAQALTLLAHRGLVETRPGTGTFRAADASPVAAGDTTWQTAALEITDNLQSEPNASRRFSAQGLDATLATPAPEVVDLNGGYLHHNLQPVGLMSTAIGRASRRTEAWERPPAEGIPGLRDFFAHDIGGGLSRTDILIVPGGQSGLATALRAVTQPGDPVIIESPTYPGTLAATRAAGARPVLVPLDNEGVIPVHLDEALRRSRARVVVLQPLHQNPTGGTMSPQRQAEVRQLAAEHDAFVVEDDFARHLTHADARPTPPPLVSGDSDGHVIHLRSLTKVTSPNLRIAAIAARGPVIDRIRSAFTIDHLLVPALLQYAALETVTSPGWRRSLGQLQRHLAERRKACLEDLARQESLVGPRQPPEGGYHLWLRLPPGCDADVVARAALRHGVAVTPGANYYPPGSGGARHLRISYVATPTINDLRRGLEHLAMSLATE